MSCCIPGCTDRPQKWAVNCPRDEQLLARWKSAIQAGTGECLSDESIKLGAPICNIHFVIENANGEPDCYREPSLFYRKNILLEVSCCRLCFRYDSIDNMLDEEDCLSRGNPLQWLANKYFGLLLLATQAQSVEGYFCKICTSTVDVSDTFGQLICDAVEEYRMLLQKMANERMVVTRVASSKTIGGEPLLANAHVEKLMDDSLKEVVGSEESQAHAGQIIVKTEPLAEVSEACLLQQTINAKSTIDDTLKESVVKEQQDCTTGLSDTAETTIVKKEPEYELSEPSQLNEITEADITGIFDDIFVKEEVQLNESCSSSIEMNVALGGDSRTEQTTTEPIIVKQEPQIEMSEAFQSEHSLEEESSEIFEDIFVKEEARLDESSLPTQDLVSSEDKSQAGQKPSSNPCSFKCFICNTFHDICDSVSNSTTKESYRCKKCNVAFDTVFAFNIGKWRCKICDAMFPSAASHADHQKTHQMVQTETEAKVMLPCKVCRGIFEYPKEILSHFKRVHPEVSVKTYPCSECDEVFLTPRTCHAHRITHTYAFVCNQCCTGYVSKLALADHQRSVHGVVACPMCGKVCEQGHQYLSHLQTHKTHTASCGKRNRDREKQQVHHKPSLQSPVCSKCGKIFRFPSELYVHRKQCLAKTN